MSATDQQPKTRVRHFRMEDELFEEFADNAAEDGRTASGLVRHLMRTYNEAKRAERARNSV